MVPSLHHWPIHFAPRHPSKVRVKGNIGKEMTPEAGKQEIMIIWP